MRRIALTCLLTALLLAACDRFAPAATPTAPAATPTAPQPGSPTATHTLPPATPRPFTATATRFATLAAPASDTPTPTPYVPSATALPSATSDGCSARHTVQAGERLYRIGLQYGVAWQEIARVNNIGDPALIYPGQVLCIPAGGGAPATLVPPTTAPPAASVTATAPPPPTTATGSAGAATILSFAAYPPSTSPGATITLAWTTSGGATALLVEPICCANNGGNLSREVPVNGSAKVSTSSAVERDTLVYSLFLTGADGSSASQSVQVPLTCPDTYFFNAPAGLLPCPAGPPVSTAASEQVFEHGRMIWLGGTNTILVLFGDGLPPNGPGLPPSGYASFPDTWTQAEPESDPALTPPAGLFQPVRGFGKVWRGELVPGQTVRDALGWALAPEQPYTGMYQRPWKTCLMAATDGTVTSCSGPGPILYLTNAEGRLIRVAEFGALERHSIAQWAFWSP